MGSFSLNASQIADYNRDGYIIVKGLFSAEEVGKLYDTAIENSGDAKECDGPERPIGKEDETLAMVYAGRRCVWIPDPE